MKTRGPSSVLLIGWLLISGPALAVDIDLTAQSPFISTTQSAPPAAAGPIEFRGMVPGLNGQLLFSILDTTSKSSELVALNQAGYFGQGGTPFIVRSHRQVGGREEITVEYRGQRLTLGLRASKVNIPRMATPAPPPPVATTAPVSNPVPPAVTQSVTTNPTPESEEARFKDLADEIARRREARSNPPPAAGATAPSPPPPDGAAPAR